SLHTAFLFACLASFIWQFTYSIAYNVSDYDLALKIMKIGYIGVIFIPVAFYQFFYLLLEMKGRIDKILLFLSYLLTLFFLFSLFVTDNFLDGLYRYFWGFYPKAGSIQPFLVALLLFVSMRAMYTLVILLLHPINQDKEKRQQRLIVLCGYFVYVFAIMDFIPNYGIEIYPFGFLFGLIFLSAIAYSIIRLHLFVIKNIAAEALTLFLVLILGLRLFFVDVLQSRLLDTFIFGGMLAVGVFLVRSVANQVKQKDQLADLNQNLEQKVAEQTKEIKVAYEVEKEARIKLEELDKTKTDFILAAQHNLRTPLTIAKGHLEEAEMATKEGRSVDFQAHLDKTAGVLDTLGKLVNGLIDITQLKVGKTGFSKKE
ncbi:MAG: histidine kinase N-terminal 7TM domain-containing protein, partial [Patescibacteria group bacterium]